MRKLFVTALSILLILAVCPLGMFTLTASAETSGSCGENLTWRYDTSTNTLTISGTGEMSNYRYDYDSNEIIAPWRDYAKSMQTVIINNGVTSIGDGAFPGCSRLTSVTIGNSVTTIGMNAFYNCYRLTSIIIPDSVTSIGGRAFSYCSGLTSIAIPDSVTSIGNSAFSDTAWYNNQPNGLVYAGRVAYKMKGTSPSSVTIKEGTLGIAGYAFYECSGLTSVTIPDSVTSIGWDAFFGCSGLTSIQVNSENPIFHSAGNCLIETGSKALIVGCKNSVIPTDGSVTSIGKSAFFGCSGLTSVTIPDSVTTIGDSAFYNCTGLTSITIPDSVTTIGDSAFYYCDELTSVTIGNSVTTIGKRAFSYCSGLTSVTIGNSVTSIDNDAFYRCTQLKSVFYCGTEAKWQSISIGSSNTPLEAAERQYHAYGEWTVVTEYSCISNGLEQRVCSVCGQTEEREISAHHTERLLYSVAPSCIEGGYSVWKCTACGMRHTKEETSPLGHDCKNVRTVPATCVTAGYHLYHCERCGEDGKTILPAQGHFFRNGVCLDCGAAEQITSFDLNGDVEVNAQDLAELMVCLLQNGSRASFDITGDGVTNILDLIRMKKILATQ